MGEADTEAWTTAAAAELGAVPADLLELGAAKARRECTHHSYIVPTILKEIDESWARRRMLREGLLRKEPAPADDFEPWVPEDGELEAIKAQAAERLRAERKG